MNATTLALAALVAILTSLAVTWSVVPPAPAGEGDQALLERIADLEQELEELRGQQAAAGAQGQPEPASYEPVQRTEDVDALIAREVQRYFAENPVGPPSGGEPLAEGELTEEQKTALLEESIRAFLDPQTDWDDGEKLWARLHAAGLMEEAIALLESEVERDPSNVNLKVQLGNAYLQPIMQGEASGPQAGTWSMKADKMYDEALALDDHNWDARFAKAISLSFWPPIFGKQPEAIKHFEILVDQQEKGSPEPGFVETYVLLGNLYRDSGDAAKAEQMWNRGLTQFPGNAQLRAQLGLE